MIPGVLLLGYVVALALTREHWAWARPWGQWRWLVSVQPWPWLTLGATLRWCEFDFGHQHGLHAAVEAPGVFVSVSVSRVRVPRWSLGDLPTAASLRERLRDVMARVLQERER